MNIGPDQGLCDEVVLDKDLVLVLAGDKSVRMKGQDHFGSSAPPLLHEAWVSSLAPQATVEAEGLTCGFEADQCHHFYADNRSWIVVKEKWREVEVGIG